MKPKTASKKLLPFFRSLRFFGFAIFLVGVSAYAVIPLPVLSDVSPEVQQKIDDTNVQIATLEKEITQYEDQLTVIGAAKKTLQNEINRIDLSRKKIAADIAVTQKKIVAANLELQQLGRQISDKQTRIENNKTTIAASLAEEYRSGDMTLVEHMATQGGIASAWEETGKRAELNSALDSAIADLTTIRQSLTNDFNVTQTQQGKLVALNKDLAGQEAVLNQNHQEQTNLLAQTKNKESTYQQLIAQKQRAKLEFEKELSNYEATLKYTFNPTEIPKAGSGVLSFPLGLNYMARCQNQKNIYGNIYCVTQYFGNTPFARTGAYNGQGHNGVDFGAPEGTEIVAALSGTVVDTGNTDLQAGCYSYGKWVLVKHDNGLSSIYGHLSVISVVKGESVATGQLLGYSGKTGYATGPHLHFGLYVASQVRVLRLGDVKVKTNCGNVYMPVAPTEAYLNPMSYL